MWPPYTRFDRLPAREGPEGLQVFTAVGLRARALGLAWLDDLPLAVALHLPRCRAVHTLGMRFPLDLAWLDGNGVILRVDRDVPPRRHVGCARGRSVIELRAGGGRRLFVGQRPLRSP